MMTETDFKGRFRRIKEAAKYAEKSPWQTGLHSGSLEALVAHLYDPAGSVSPQMCSDGTVRMVGEVW